MGPSTTTVSHVPLPSSQQGETFVPEFCIRSYEAADNQAVCELFAEGMLFYAPPVDEDPWLHDGFQAYVQGCFEGDLASIEKTLKLYDRLGYTRTHHDTIREEPLYYLVWFLKKLE